MTGVARLASIAILAVVSVSACSGQGQATDARDLERATLKASYRAPTRIVTAGAHDLTAQGIPALLFVPRSYRPERRAPLLVLLHGAGQRADEWTQPDLLELFDAQDAVIVSVNSAGMTWDGIRDVFGVDIARIDSVLAATMDYVNVDTARVAIGGFSDGGSYALSVGLANGTRFSAILAFSPGFMNPPGKRGKPRVFLAHGTRDQVLPISQSSRAIWGLLQTDGYDVTYKEFAGRHGIYTDVVTEALTWFAAQPANP